MTDPFRTILKTISSTSVLAMAMAAPLAISPALAQDEATESDETLVVTARRREETLQEVPIAVSAYSGDELEALGANDITYLAQTTPNTTLKVSRGTNSTLTAFIRGIGQQDPVAGFEAGVGIYLDDVYLNRPQGAVLDIFDVERVEVLRGPQGTLYGRNTIGGAVKYVTKRLGGEPALRVHGAIGTFGQKDLVITTELPITDTLAVGGSIAILSRDGYGENINTGAEHYNKDVLAFRASAEWTPTPDLFFRVTADHTQDDSNSKAGHRLLTGGLSGAPVLDDVFDTRYGIEGDNYLEQYGISLLGEWEISENLTFKSITAYREDEGPTIIDFDSLPAADLDVPAVYNNDQFSQEFQLLYEGDLISGVAGFYYLDAYGGHAFDVVLQTTADLLGLPGLNAYTQGDVDTNTWSVFADVTFDLMAAFDIEGIEGLELSVGGRYTDDERSSQVFRSTLFAPGNTIPVGGTLDPNAGSITSNFNGSDSWSDFTPRVSLAVQPDEQNTIYVSYAEGFKGGSFDPRGQTTAAPDIDNNGTVTDAEIFEYMQFDPETVQTYEIGYKHSSASGASYVNTAAFYSDYTDVQVPGSIGIDTDGDGVADTFAGATTNAGAATIWGVEFESSALLHEDMLTGGDSLTAVGTVGYINAQYDEFIVNGVNVADERQIQNTPEWTSNLRIVYTRPMNVIQEGELALIGSWSYKSLTHQFEIANPLDQPAYSLFDASAVWSSADGHYQIGIHGKNLADEEYIVAGYDFVTASTLGLEGVLNAFYGAPRTVTGTIGVKF